MLSCGIVGRLWLGGVFGGVLLLSIVGGLAQPASWLDFNPSYVYVPENAGTVTLRIGLRGDTNQTVTVEYATRDGGALDGLDYVGGAGTVTFAPGQTEQTISIPILNDGFFEYTEGFSVALGNPTEGAALGAWVAWVYILDNDSGPQFSTSTLTVNENAGEATITVSLATDETNTVTVNYATSDGSATAGFDYIPVFGTLTFAPGETNQSFTVPILNDGLTEDAETVLLTLSNITGVTAVGWLTNASLTILDNDPGLQFSSARYSIWETGGVATITVLRGDDWNDPVTVDYATSDATATAGADYTPRTGTLHFDAGETQKSFTIPIINDGLTEGPENLHLILSGLTGAVSFGATSNALLTIVDDERPSDHTAVNPKVIAAGPGHTLALKADRSLWAWGDNYYGQLGTGAEFSTRTNVPVRVGSDLDWVSVAAGSIYTLALKGDGSLWAWGDNGNGQLGIANVTRTNVPARVGFDNDWAAVAIGGGFTLALKTDGTLWAWGANWEGQFGDGTWNSSSVSVQVGTNNDWRAIATGLYHALALKTDGSLWGWGRNNSGQLGLGPDVFRTLVPERVSPENDWDIVVTAGGESGGWERPANGDTLAVKTDGSLWGWGYNYSGQLGDGTMQSSTVPEPIGVENDWATIAAGPYHTTALKTDGRLWAWGANWNGQLGNGTWDSTNSPVPVGSDSDWMAIVVGENHSVAMKADGSLWAWGANYNGQLGIGAEFNTSTNVPVRIGADNDWAVPVPAAVSGEFRITAQSSGPGGELALSFTHTNSRAYYILYRGTSVTNIHQPVEARLANTLSLMLTDATPFSSNATAFYQIRAVPLNQPLDLDGDGIDDAYELRHARFLNPLNSADATQDFDGDGRSNRREYHDGSNPEFPQDWHRVAAGLYHILALKADGSLWAWGDNSYGQLGDGTTDSRTLPVRIGLDNDWRSVTAGRHTQWGDYSIALKRDGSLWAWGANIVGQLGTGDIFAWTNIPLRVGFDRGSWAAASAGSSYTLALKTDGTLWAWGLSPALGLNLTNGPGQVSFDRGWRAIAAGGAHALALKTDGSLWAWGDNLLGSCGVGMDVLSTGLTRVGTDNDWSAIAASGDDDLFDGRHSLAVKTDGSLWAWGSDDAGELGIGAGPGNVFIPTRVGTDTDWSVVVAGHLQTLARKRDGSLWAWGYRRETSPAPFDAGNDWQDFIGGGLPFGELEFSVALKTDGSLWWAHSPDFLPRRLGTDNDWGSPP
jgi:alpha-tubulin suppressor-like RCC1 family protein